MSSQYPLSIFLIRYNKAKRPRFTTVVPDYEVVHPKKVNKNGKLLSHELSHDEESYRPGKHGDLHYNIKAFGENFNLHLKKNRKLFAKDLEVEVLGHQGKILRKEKVKNCYYHGYSRNHLKSRATLSTCDNLVSSSWQIRERFLGNVTNN